MPTKNPIYAFVDIETTGSRANLDRITEVGIVTLENQEVSEWSGLINPGVSIPNNIQQLTGITPTMVSAKPSFAEIAEELYLELKDKIFVAHNARFDYSFLKAEFKRLGIDFSPKVICTVKLSRRLFPNQARHNLDTLIAVHGLQVENRHRALDDAKLLHQFWQRCEATFDQEHFQTQIDYLLGRPSLPPHIDRELIDEIPNRPGVYLFYAENKQPLYIGKSNDLRARVMSHFQASLTKRKEMKLSLQVRDIDWIETSGELGALLLESRLIKEKLPSLNIKLRRSRDLCAWQLIKGPNHLELRLVNHHELQPGKQDHLYGLFYSKREATQTLQSIAKRNQLCEGLLGFEKLTTGSPCFGFHVKQCKGACIGAEPRAIHDLRLQTALLKLKVAIWPYSGAIGIREGEDLHLFDHWCYLGNAISEQEIEELLKSGEPEFDLDIYKLIKKALKSLPQENVLNLSTYQRYPEYDYSTSV
ncbi:3'-5' exonuclease family protein [Polynucleobacter acidiphobus]|uniref:3'-5' exonuclease family protein n=1 Tax=Polynucleobacter acidiphobus TaxID=556053 RepID=UPI000D393BB7|nr:3'-5' exonuclease family protein [Polynucleobacter acidiphobus]